MQQPKMAEIFSGQDYEGGKNALEIIITKN